MGTGVLGWQLADGSVMMCRGGLGTFFLPIILNLFSQFVCFFVTASLKKSNEYNMVLRVLMEALRR